ncbi:MAG: DUF2934 domain-containing protein [Acidobacteriaceae bacterium]|nr:DUF2934 domain-containing protein [Acidobacteriaceae bacterium]MBV9036737.1 DUF2934 domain-containing protein [Acidobacteriaceae bacterium]MBV9223169.1 DUF2934 domain-containing protein [Acidobacteriaceae bacterium]MBV9306013.1 DUF2934 domain-containing protein [Acidobacteriaceae bacterium]MBV9677114.1 DUF2934 domain-containing protein [Acidobacteriaceae bacterium]
MQSRKVSNSKKTSKSANEAAINENHAAAEVTAKPRASRSSKAKKETSPETPFVKNGQKSPVGAANIPAFENSLVAKTLGENVDTPKVMAAAAGHESAFFEAAVIDPVGVVSPLENRSPRQNSREDVAELAYSYWIARGYSHGHAEEDWLRAEAELAGKR